MGFYELLTGEEARDEAHRKLTRHNIQAILGEVERGKMTLTQAGDLFGLTTSERTEALDLFNKIVHPRECISFGGRLVATNIGTTYITLGAALLQQAGITQIIFGVRVTKVGTGTQSWRLFNVTDNEEVALIDDTAAAGAEKNLNVTVNFSPGRSPGMKTFLVQGKSTTAADDPIFCGAAISIRRFDVLTAVELHEILLGIEAGQYPTAVALKARLGVA